MAIRRAVVTRPCPAARPAGGSAGCQASHGYPLRINGHLVLEDGWPVAFRAAARDGLPAAGGGTSSAAAGWM
jgi:hypothetical protein